MGTITKLCGIVGFIGLSGILTASCATAEEPTGDPDNDGRLATVEEGMRRYYCACLCNDGHQGIILPLADSLEDAERIARELMDRMRCNDHGGIRNGTFFCQ